MSNQTAAKGSIPIKRLQHSGLRHHTFE